MTNQALQQLLLLIINNAPNLVGVVLPVVIDLLNRKIPPENDRERFLISAAVSLAVATILKWNTIQYGTPDQIIFSFGLIFTESQLVFKLYFQNSFLRQKLLSAIKSKSVFDVVSASPSPLG